MQAERKQLHLLTALSSHVSSNSQKMNEPKYCDTLDTDENDESVSSEKLMPQDMVETAKEEANKATEPTFFHVPVLEKVIFCIDAHIFKWNERAYSLLRNLINNYIELKQKINVKPPDFEIRIVGDNKFVPVPVPVPSKKAFPPFSTLPAQNLDETETDTFSLSELFVDLAGFVELPDPCYYNRERPPPHIYHFIIIFGRNKFVPTLDFPNAFYFLIDSPYVFLDVVYMHNSNIKEHKYKKISQTLRRLVNEKGYFHECDASQYASVEQAINECLGHPLIRQPQKSSLFNVSHLQTTLNK